MRAVVLSIGLALSLVPPAGAQPEGAPCPDGVATAETAAVSGVVRDSATGVALPAARVTFTWDRGPDQAIGEADAVTDAEGRYAVCPVPTGVPLTLASTFPRRRAEAVVMLPSGRDRVRLDFVLTGIEAPDADRPSRVSLLETGAAGTSITVTGTVRDQATGAPLVGAQVSVPALGIGTVSVPGGRFRIDGIPKGEHVLRVEHLGYRAAEATIGSADSDLTAVAWLAPQAIAMDALEVRARSIRSDVERGSGASRYRLSRSDFEDRPAATLTEILRSKVPGLRTGRDGRGCPVLETRRGRALIVVDGMPFRDGCVLAEVDPDAIESVEVLSTVAASTRWGSLGGNGVIEITTRRR